MLVNRVADSFCPTSPCHVSLIAIYMATPRNKLRNTKKERKPWPNEVLGILLCGFGVLLLLSLISFSGSDPAIFQFLGGADGDAATAPGKNWIGPVGAIIGYVFFALFGVAAYLLRRQIPLMS